MFLIDLNQFKNEYDLDQVLFLTII